MRQTGRKLKIPTTPSSGLTLRCNAQNSGRCFTYFYWFVIKDVTQEQAEGRDALRKAWGGGSGEAQDLPRLLQVCHLPAP